MKRRALFSVYHKDGIEAFAKFLADRGYEIVSTGGTKRYLEDHGIQVTQVADITGFPEILGGRVKTLHPVVHGGLLAMRSNPDHQTDLEKHQIAPIDFVVVNLYPFEETISNPNAKMAEVIEQIDIGGVALIRAAAKNYHDVVTIVHNSDMQKVMDLVEAGEVDEQIRLELSAKAFSHTAYYDGLISSYFNNLSGRKLPDEYSVPLKKEAELRYGENPHQSAALYRSGVDKNVSALNATVLWGKALSYNNMMDADAAIDIVREFYKGKPFVVVMKHTNPCGAALGGTLVLAYKKALAGDPVSAFGGIVATNMVLDAETAALIVSRFYEIVIATDFSDEALEILKTKKNLRILKLEGSDWTKKGLAYRRVENGMLVQDWDAVGTQGESFEVVTEKTPEDSLSEDLHFAWLICKYVKSNAIVYVKDGQVLGVGAGQMSRVDSAEIGVKKATQNDFAMQGAVMASDAFFPFRDSVDAAARQGIVAIIQPGGSIRDEESITAANEHGIAMVFTRTRHFKH